MSSDSNGEAQPTPSAKVWNPDSALSALAQERTVMDVNLDDATQVAEAVSQIFRENAQAAALSVVFCALHDPSPRVRLDASKYVIEHATRVAEGDADPLTTLVKEFYALMENPAAVSSSDSTTPTTTPYGGTDAGKE